MSRDESLENGIIHLNYDFCDETDSYDCSSHHHKNRTYHGPVI